MRSFTKVIPKSNRRLMRHIKVACMVPHSQLRASILRNRLFVVTDNRPRCQMLFIEWITKDKDGVESVKSYAIDMTNMELAT